MRMEGLQIEVEDEMDAVLAKRNSTLHRRRTILDSLWKYGIFG